jgi:hypothetical protein
MDRGVIDGDAEFFNPLLNNRSRVQVEASEVAQGKRENFESSGAREEKVHEIGGTSGEPEQIYLRKEGMHLAERNTAIDGHGQRSNCGEVSWIQAISKCAVMYE